MQQKCPIDRDISVTSYSVYIAFIKSSGINAKLIFYLYQDEIIHEWLVECHGETDSKGSKETVTLKRVNLHMTNMLWYFSNCPFISH